MVDHRCRLLNTGSVRKRGIWCAQALSSLVVFRSVLCSPWGLSLCERSS